MVTKSRLAAVAAILATAAGWMVGADCVDSSIECHMMYIQRMFVAVGDLVSVMNFW